MRIIAIIILCTLFFFGGAYVGQHLLKQDVENGTEISVEMSTYICKIAKVLN